MSTENSSTEPTDAPDAPAPQPVLRVVNPDATPEEIAAIVAVFASLGGGEAPPPAPRSEWALPARRMRRDLPHGLGAWRASSLPR